MPSAAETWVAPGAGVAVGTAVGVGVGVSVGMAVGTAVGVAVHVAAAMVAVACSVDGPQPETMTLTRSRRVGKRYFGFISSSFGYFV